MFYPGGVDGRVGGNQGDVTDGEVVSASSKLHHVTILEKNIFTRTKSYMYTHSLKGKRIKGWCVLKNLATKIVD